MKFALAVSGAVVAGACLAFAIPVARSAPVPNSGKFDERKFIEDRLAPLIRPGEPYPDALDVVVKGENPYPVMTGVDGSERRLRQKIASDTRTLFTTSQFDKLEAMAIAFRTVDTRTPSGFWKTDLFYSAFDVGSSLPTSEYERMFRQTRAYRHAYPQSVTPSIIDAQLQLALAWKALTRASPGEQATPEERAAFFKHLERAATDLNEANELGDPRPGMQNFDPHLAVVSGSLARSSAVARSDYEALVIDAETLVPDYAPFYFEVTFYYAPQWHHDPAAIDRLASQAVKASKTEGAALYARIYSHLFAFQGRDALQAAKIDRDLLLTGVADVLQRFPDRQNFESFARLACALNDLDLARPLMARLQTLPQSEFLDWDLGSYQTCRAAIYEDDKAEAQTAH